ncbi:MAG: DUF5694 domain-containing protein [Saprospiraceae bacterium]
MNTKEVPFIVQRFHTFKKIFDMKNLMLFTIYCLFCFTAFAQDTTNEALLIGTFHFHNPGADLAQTKSFDILSETSQKELETISNAIAQYNPDKIFVEWEYDEQTELDEKYQEYLAGENKDWTGNFYTKNEIFQLAARTAKKLNHSKLYAMDYGDTSFPFDSIMQVIQTHDQQALLDELMQLKVTFEGQFNALIERDASLTEMLNYLNQPEIRTMDMGLYTNLLAMAGDTNNFIGAFTAAEWYRRNIYMLSLIQKMTEAGEKVMILGGSSHIAMFEHLLSLSPNWKTKELIEVLKVK